MRDEWTIETEMEVPGKRRSLKPGVEFKAKGKRGCRYRFKERVTTPSGDSWISAWGGVAHHEQWVALPADIEITWIDKERKRD